MNTYYNADCLPAMQGLLSIPTRGVEINIAYDIQLCYSYADELLRQEEL